jgi:hypothetical protein
VAGLGIDPPALAADEGGAAVTYDLVLTSAPTADVVVDLDYGADLTVDPTRSPSAVATGTWPRPSP